MNHQIPIRTFSDWDEKRPGFLEVDLVGHEGGNSSGYFAQTLDATDVCTETRAVKNKARVWVFAALMEIEARLPFAMLGSDSDNGGEFINAHLVQFCDEAKITFTWSRRTTLWYAGRSGTGEYDTEEELAVLNELYDHLRLYANFFQPVMKLLEKTRVDS